MAFQPVNFKSLQILSTFLVNFGQAKDTECGYFYFSCEKSSMHSSKNLALSSQAYVPGLNNYCFKNVVKNYFSC